MKALRLIVVLVMLAVLTALVIINWDKWEPENPGAYSANLTPHDQAVMSWQPGDDITPYPQFGDCDDATLYDYLFLTNIGQPANIMYGKSFWEPTKYHVWVVSENWTYDAGIALQNMNWKGREITYYQLLIYAEMDWR